MDNSEASGALMNQDLKTSASPTFTGGTYTSNLGVSGSLTVKGMVTAEEFHTEFVSASIVYRSGSTKFGDTIDDIHSFTGSINQSGSFNLNDGNMTIADTLTAATVDINAGTVDAITSLTVANDVDVGNYKITSKALEASDLTAGRVTFAGANGLLADDSDLTFSTATLTATNITGTTIKDFSTISGSSTSTGSFGSVHTAGNVGIGVTSPSSLLEVAGADGTDGGELALTVLNGNVGNNDIIGKLVWKAPLENSPDGRLPGAAIWAEAQAGYTTSVNKTALFFGTGNSESALSNKRMIIDEDGNVGIGTEGPGAYRLNVDGEVYLSTGDDYFVKTAFDSTPPTLEVSARNIKLGDFDGVAGETYFELDDVNTKFTFSNGNVGIGNTAPPQPLTVEGNISGSGNLDIDGNAVFNGQIWIDDSADADLKLEANGSGDAQIGFWDGGSNKAYLVWDRSDDRMELNTSLDFEVQTNLLTTGNISGSSTSTGSFGSLVVKGNIASEAYFDAMDEGLAFHYPFNEGGNSTAFDKSLNGLNGILNGTVQYISTGSTAGGSLNFTDGYVENGYDPKDGPKTMAYWVNFDTVSTGDYQLMGTQEIPAYFYSGIANGGQGYYYAGNVGGTVNYTFAADKWYHIVLTMDSAGGGTSRYYVNGIQRDSKSYSSSGNSTVDFWIGKLHGANTYPFNADINDFRYYERQLSDDEIYNLYSRHAGISEIREIGNISGSAASTGSFGSVHTAGNVGIGASNPTANLHVEGSTGDVVAVDGDNGRLLTVINEMSGSIFSANTVAGLPVIEAMSDYTVKLDPFGNGKVGIGTSTMEDGQLTLLRAGENVLVVRRNGSDGEMVRFMNGGSDCGSIDHDGSGTAYNESSDYRLKENEVAISNSLTKINQLKPYSFNFKDYPDVTRDGFFAHEVQFVVPYAVKGEKDAVKDNGEIDIQMLDNSKLVPLLVASVQELTSEVQSLRAAITGSTDLNQLKATVSGSTFI
jgi:hypothetical protein